MSGKRSSRNHLIRMAGGAMIAMLTLIAGPAAATQEYILPTLFDVTGVAQNDALNIRSAPNAQAVILGTLAPDARNIEVVGFDETGRWAQVNAGPVSGWASARYLDYQVDVWKPDELPATLQCRGNEPFWSLRPQGDTLVFSTPDARDREMAIEEVLDTGVFRDPRRAVTAQDGSDSITAFIVPMACSDGMSDRAYGLDVTAVVKKSGLTQLLNGCCTIAS